MPALTKSSPSAATQKTASQPETGFAAPQAPLVEFASGRHNRPPTSNQSKTPVLTAANILSLQRTIGNQAVQRLIQQQRKPAARPALPARQPEVAAKSETHLVPAVAAETHHSVQRLPSEEEIIKRGNPVTDPLKAITYTFIFKLLNEYNPKREKFVGVNQPEREAQADLMKKDLKDLTTAADLYINQFKKSKSNQANVQSFNILKAEIEVELKHIKDIVKDKDFDVKATEGAGDDVYGTEDNSTWDTVLTNLKPEGKKAVIEAHGDADLKTNQAGKKLKKLGLPEAYIKTLTQPQVDMILITDKALEDGDLGKADTGMTLLKEALPATFTLLSGNMMRKNIGKLNPELAKAITKPKYKQKDQDMIAKGDLYAHEGELDKEKKDFAKGFDTQVENFETPKHNKGWVKKNVDFGSYKSLKKHEKSAIFSYSGYFQKFNVPLRGNVSPGEEDAAKEEGPGVAENNGYSDPAKKPSGAKFSTGSLALTQNLISALNRLPPFKGMVYRHDSNFSGFSQLNQVGATVTDMAFVSSTKDPEALQEISGSGKPEVLSLIKSKSGRYVTPGSAVQHENEVLFKPGTQFKVTKRVDAHEVPAGNGMTKKAWPVRMDSELKTILDIDQEKPKVKIVVKKEEV